MSTTTGIIQQGSNTSEWTPASLTGIFCWYDAADASTVGFDTGNRVNFWGDKSGNNNYAWMWNPSFYPEYPSETINSLSTMYFNTYLLDSVNNTGITGQSSRTIALVVKYQSSDAQFFGLGERVSGRQWGPWQGSGYKLSLWSGSSDPQGAFDYNVSSPRIYLFEHDGSYSTIGPTGAGGIGQGSTVYINGVGQAWTAGNSITLNTTNSPIRLGSLQGGSSTSTFHLGEVIVLPGLLDTTEKGQLYNYLSNKWNIPI